VGHSHCCRWDHQRASPSIRGLASTDVGREVSPSVPSGRHGRRTCFARNYRTQAGVGRFIDLWRGAIDETRPRSPAVEKVTLVLEGVSDGKVRVNSASLDHPFVILAGEALEIVGIEKKIMMGRVGRSAYWLDHDPTRMVEAGYDPTTK
jgi:hypothetical protein